MSRPNLKKHMQVFMKLAPRQRGPLKQIHVRDVASDSDTDSALCGWMGKMIENTR